jgi:ribonuclease VapC
MSGYVLDSYALIAYFRNEPSGETLLGYLEAAADNSLHLSMTTYNLGEVYYMICRKHSAAEAELVLQHIWQLPVEIYQPDWELTYAAARLKAGCRLSYADAHAAALALHLQATLLTGDREFEHLKHIKKFRVKYLQ